MTINNDIKIIRDRFIAAFDTTAVQTVFDNAPTKAIDETRPYILFGVNPNGAQQATIGTAGFHTHSGLIWLKIVTPKQSLVNPAYELAEQFTLAFRNWRSATFDLHATVETIRQVPDDNAFVVLVTIPYLSNR